MQNIVWKRPDGGVCVYWLVDAVDPAEEEARLKINRDIPADYEHVCSNATYPPDKTWRAAWAWITDDPVIDICPVRAVEVTKARLRLERAPLLAELDLAYMRADESGDVEAKKKIAAEKQRLRDLPNKAHEIAHGDLQALAALKASA